MTDITLDQRALLPSDLEISVWPDRSGPGMQFGLSKGVKVIHKPTGITVICDNERSQHKNRDACIRAIEAALRLSAGEDAVERLDESEKDVALGQAVELAEYVERQAKGTMRDAAKRFLSLSYSQTIAARLSAGADWRTQAAVWLESKAKEQEANNERWPDHAACYQSWRDRPQQYRQLASELLAAPRHEPVGVDPTPEITGAA